MPRTSKESIRYSIFSEVFSPDFQGKYECIRERALSLRGFAMLLDVIDFLHDERDLDWDGKNAVLYDLLCVARSDDSSDSANAVKILFAAFWPGLDRIATKLESSPAEIDDPFSEVYAVFLDQVVAWNLEKKDKIAANILRNTHKHVIRQYTDTRNTSTLPLSCMGPCGDDFGGVCTPGNIFDFDIDAIVEKEHEELFFGSMLLSLIGINVISAEESEMIKMRVFHRMEIEEIAELKGIKYRTACKRLCRAFERMKIFFGNEKRFRERFS